MTYFIYQQQPWYPVGSMVGNVKIEYCKYVYLGFWIDHRRQEETQSFDRENNPHKQKTSEMNRKCPQCPRMSLEEWSWIIVYRVPRPWPPPGWSSPASSPCLGSRRQSWWPRYPPQSHISESPCSRQSGSPRWNTAAWRWFPPSGQRYPGFMA